MANPAQLITAFSKKTSPGAFRRLSRKTVAQQLSARVAKPYLINQGQAGVCPAAALVYGIARHRPAVYVRMVTELFDKGTTRVDRWVLEPCADLKGFCQLGGKELGSRGGRTWASRVTRHTSPRSTRRTLGCGARGDGQPAADGARP